MRICLWNINNKVRRILDRIIAKIRQPHQRSSTALALYHVADRLFIQGILRQRTDHKDTILDQTDRSML